MMMNFFISGEENDDFFSIEEKMDGFFSRYCFWVLPLIRLFKIFFTHLNFHSCVPPLI